MPELTNSEQEQLLLNQIKEARGNLFYHEMDEITEADYDAEYEDEDFTPEGFEYADWLSNQTDELVALQEAVIIVGYGPGFEMHRVDEDFHKELETAAYWRLNEIAEELEIELTCQLIGLK